MAKELKLWNGRDQFHYRGTMYVAAESRKEAARLILKSMSKEGNDLSLDQTQVKRMCRELKEYFHDTWGTKMNELVPIPEKGVWIQRTYSSQEPIERLL